MAKILDGKSLAKSIRKKVKVKVEGMGFSPGLAVIIVGNNPASRIYVDNKKKDCIACGITSKEYALPENIGEAKLLALIHELNNTADVHGILVQLPLPDGYDVQKIVQTISPNKDVDAFHMQNVGRVLNGDYGFLPCTPAGVVEILNHYEIETTGKHCVVVGHSNIVGKPWQ